MRRQEQLFAQLQRACMYAQMVPDRGHWPVFLTNYTFYVPVPAIWTVICKESAKLDGIDHKRTP